MHTHKRSTKYFIKMYTELRTYSKYIREGACGVGEEVGHRKGAEQRAFIHGCQTVPKSQSMKSKFRISSFMHALIYSIKIY